MRFDPALALPDSNRELLARWFSPETVKEVVKRHDKSS
jgi:hypothetical protein